jgi:hypothetical protein
LAIEENYTLYYIDSNQNKIILHLSDTTKIEKLNDNRVDWTIHCPSNNKDYLVTVTATGSGAVRSNPVVTVTEVEEE